VVLSEKAIFQYKVDNVYNKESEFGNIFSDPAIGIDWKLSKDKMLLSDKDLVLPQLKKENFFTTAEYKTNN
jgi:dTDP-4-dehydrorhamnose 3,5-epimerase